MSEEFTPNRKPEESEFLDEERAAEMTASEEVSQTAEFGTDIYPQESYVPELEQDTIPAPASAVAAAAPFVGARIAPMPPLYQEAAPDPVRRVLVRYSSFWPFLVLALSFLTFLIAQFSAQIKGAGELAKMQEEREKQVSASVKVQADLEKIVVDLLELSKSNTKAETVVAKYGIKQSPPATAEPNK